jgi:formate dehydrogenase subunit gamma
MAETTSRSPEVLSRFDRGERVLHWTNAVLFLTLLATGSAMYIPQLSVIVGRRHTIELIHVYAGLALPFPLILTFLAGRWGAAFRADVRRLNRWTDDDRKWLRTMGRDHRAKLGKFNSGQKLNAAFTAGAIPVMLATGSLMYWNKGFSLSWRTGATFVHDWLYIGLCCTVFGHIMIAVRDADALNSMVKGTISGKWARKHAPRWYDEMGSRSDD